MRKFIKDNKKLFFMSVMLLIFVTACASVRDSDGNVLEEMIISLDTPFIDCISDSWFNLFVWPVAQLINFIAIYADAGVGIIVVTLMLNFGIASLSIKQQVATQKMQIIQPEIQRIQAKYEGKTDQASRIKQGNEVNAIYKKYDINPFGSILTMFIQLPIILSVYQAVLRSQAVITGSFMGIDLTQTPTEGVLAFDQESIPVAIIFLLMVLFQFISLKLPQYLQKKRKQKQNVKTKDYANNKQQDGMGNQMNMMMYMSLAMIVFFSLSWPLGMSFYWMVSAFSRIVQNLVIQKFFIKEL